MSVLGDTFFFSSRRRHTRYIGDWSSDVCSSDLSAEAKAKLGNDSALREIGEQRVARRVRDGMNARSVGRVVHSYRQRGACFERRKIGRASCRERGEVAGGEGGVATTVGVEWL